MSPQSAQFSLPKILVQASLLLFVIEACCFPAPAQAAPGTGQQKQVLILLSNEPHLPSQITIEDALRSTLQRGSSVPVDIYTEYLEDMRTQVDDYEKEFVSLLRRKYERKKFDVIFTVTQPALSVILKSRADLSFDAPIVFLALDQRDVAGLNLGTNVTGVWGEKSLKPNLELALALHPGTKQVVVLAGVGQWDKFWTAQARQDFRPFENRVQFNYLIGLTIREQQKALAGLPPSTIVMFLSSAEDNAGIIHPNPEVLRQICPASSAPIYGTSDTQLGLGIVGGSLNSLEALGLEGAKVGLRVLAGEKPQEIAPHAVPSMAMFDWRELRRWDISENSLPPGSIVRFRIPGLWDQYRYYILGAIALILLQTGLSGWLLTERRRRRQATEARRHLATIVESSEDAILSKSLEGLVLSWNHGAESMYGYSASEMIGEHVSKLCPADRKQEVAEIIERMKRGENVEHFETRRLTKDGRRIDVALTVSALKDDQGKIIGASTIARDITERKQIEEALTENQAQLAGIIGSAMDSIITVDKDQRIVLFNAAAEKTFGCPAKEAIGQLLDQFIPERFRDAHREHVRAFSESHVTRRQMGLPGELYGLRAAGEEFPIEASISQLELKGRKFFTVILRDITQRRVAEETLRQSEARFRTMADTAPVMIWIAGEDKLCTYFNQQWLDFTGRPMEQELGNGWAEGVHPDDYGRCLEIYNESFDDRKRFEMEYRLRRADGQYRWVLDSGTPRFSTAGEFRGYIGSCIDISDRKESEEALREAHNQLSELKNQLEAENIYLQGELQLDQAFGEIVGQSDAIKHVHFKISQVAATDSTVLIMGETGTGKELVARAVHGGSVRKDRPLIKVNCSALSPSLIESELFGHEKGAFTGAAARKLGRFELANTGTIFLDEIGELPLELQAKLLRVIQEGELERVGGTKTIKVDVRIIAATNRNLTQEVDRGTFRQDLWYRLNVFPITSPPLRQRREDIPLLVEHFIRVSAKKFGKTIDSVSTGTMQSLQAHSWPGNVRELANVIERAVIHSQGGVLRLADLFEAPAGESKLSAKSLEEIEREYIIRILESTGWKIEGPYGAARLLGLKPSTLRTRMAKLGVQRRLANVG